MLLGVRAVIADSFERIHRSNLVGMGVLPLEFRRGRDLAITGPDGRGNVRHPGLERLAQAAQRRSPCGPRRPTARSNEFTATVRIDTPVEVDYYRNGGILQTVLRKLASTT